jgi:hypothetical protein
MIVSAIFQIVVLDEIWPDNAEEKKFNFIRQEGNQRNDSTHDLGFSSRTKRSESE